MFYKYHCQWFKMDQTSFEVTQKRIQMFEMETFHFKFTNAMKYNIHSKSNPFILIHFISHSLSLWVKHHISNMSYTSHISLAIHCELSMILAMNGNARFPD